MKLVHRLMRLIAGTCERERQEFRREIAHLSATAEDMQRTVVRNADQIRRDLARHRAAKVDGPHLP